MSAAFKSYIIHQCFHSKYLFVFQVTLKIFLIYVIDFINLLHFTFTKSKILFIMAKLWYNLIEFYIAFFIQ